QPPGFSEKLAPPGSWSWSVVEPALASQFGVAACANSVVMSAFTSSAIRSAMLKTLSRIRDLSGDLLPCATNHLPCAVDQLQLENARDFRSFIWRRRRHLTRQRLMVVRTHVNRTVTNAITDKGLIVECC